MKGKGGRPEGHSSNRGPRINHQIRVPQCRLIGEDGHQYGVVTMSEALRIAEMQGLDLVEVSPNAAPPVVKVIDYGKFKYEEQKKAAEARKKQAVVQIKEVQFRPNIEVHDIKTKLNHIEKFLFQGDKVKLVMQFRGRELANKEIGLEKFNNIIQSCLANGAIIDADAKFMGNRVIAMLGPDKKAIQKIQQERERLAKQQSGAQKEEGKKETAQESV